MTVEYADGANARKLGTDENINDVLNSYELQSFSDDNNNPKSPTVMQADATVKFKLWSVGNTYDRAITKRIKAFLTFSQKSARQSF